MIKVRRRPGPDDLPPGYQFGDGRFNPAHVYLEAGRVLNALPFPRRSAEDLARIAAINGWNVIEGEHHS